MSPFFVFAQTAPSAIGSTEILQSAWQSKTYKQRQDELSFLHDTKIQIPLLEELELRTETQNFDLTQQEYAVRLQLNSPYQRKVATAIKTQEINLRAVALNETLEQVLYDRYRLVLEIALAEQQQQHLQEQQSWFADQKIVLQRAFEQEGERKLENLLKLEDKQLDFTRAQLVNEQQLALLRAELKRVMPASSMEESNLEPLSLLPLSALVTKLALHKPSSSSLPWQVQAQAVEVELLRLEAEGELAEQKNLLQFLQLRYTGDNDPLLQDRFTVGAGVRLPFRNANSAKQQYLELERLEEEHQKTELLEEWRDELQASEAKFATDMRLSQDLREALTNFQKQYAPLHLRDLGVTDIAVLLQAQASIYHRKKLCLEQAKVVYKSYLDVLLLSGRLTQTPYRNWWSEEEILLAE